MVVVVVLSTLLNSAASTSPMTGVEELPGTWWLEEVGVVKASDCRLMSWGVLLLPMVVTAAVVVIVKVGRPERWQ